MPLHYCLKASLDGKTSLKGAGFVVRCNNTIIEKPQDKNRLMQYALHAIFLWRERGSYIRMWLSLVEHVIWDHGVAGSNPVIRTIVCNALPCFLSLLHSKVLRVVNRSFEMSTLFIATAGVQEPSTQVNSYAVQPSSRSLNPACAIALIQENHPIRHMLDSHVRTKNPNSAYQLKLRILVQHTSSSHAKRTDFSFWLQTY